MPEVDIEYFRRINIAAEPVQKPLDEVPDALRHIPNRLESKPLPIHQPKPDLDEVLQGEVLPASLFEKSSVLRRLDLSSINSKRDVFQQLLPTIPLNEYNLPRYIYRADLIDHHLLCQPAEGSDFIQEALDAAIVHLDYYQGFPTFRDGTPMWGQMGHEPREAFEAFMVYLDLDGARTLTNVMGYSLDRLNDWYYLYFWSSRAKACDMFRAAHHARQREQRIFKTENTHYLEAERLFTRISNALESIAAEEWAEMGPSDLITSLEKVAKLQRLSAGLATTGGAETRPGNMSVELTMRQIAQDSGEKRRETVDFDTEALLTNPETLEMAQELILKFGHGHGSK